MRSDDLVPLLAPAPGPAVGYRQGLIVTWNPDTAENTVLVGRSLMTNLPILNTSEAAILAAGDVVGILTAGRTWGILGRFTIPGTPEAVTALSSLRTASETITSLEGITSTSFVASGGPTVDIAVGASGRLLVLVSADISTQRSAVAAGNTAIPHGEMGFTLSGANTLAAATSRALVVSGNMLTSSGTITFGTSGAATRAVLLTGLAPGLTTVTAAYRLGGNATQTNISQRNITAMAL